MKRKVSLLLLASILAILCGGCAGMANELIAATKTPVATLRAGTPDPMTPTTPTSAPTPTCTPNPTATPEPTNTPTPFSNTREEFLADVVDPKVALKDAKMISYAWGDIQNRMRELLSATYSWGGNVTSRVPYTAMRDTLPGGVLRQCDEAYYRSGGYYSVYAIKEGGYLYVYWDEWDDLYWREWETTGEGFFWGMLYYLQAMYTVEDFSDLKAGNTFGDLLRIDSNPFIYWYSSSIPSSYSILSNGDVLVCEFEGGKASPDENDSVITKIYVRADYRMAILGGVRDADLPW